MCFVLYKIAVEVSFQSTSISVTENSGTLSFTLNIGGQVDPMSITTVSLSASDDTASKYVTTPV